MRAHWTAIAAAASSLLLALAALYFAFAATNYVVRFDDIHEPPYPKWPLFGVMMGAGGLCLAVAGGLAWAAMRRFRSVRIQTPP